MSRKTRDIVLTILRCLNERLEKFTAMRIGGKPAACQARFWLHAVRSTHSLIGSMRPASSANGMNSVGDTAPSSGCRQRISASVPIILSELMSSCGW